jgi:uncharacterized repeat protein (TIGR01451 family)
MRTHTPALWTLAAALLLALTAALILGTPTSAAPAANITGTVTEPPTQTPTETPVTTGVPTNTATPVPGTPTTPVPGTPTDTPVIQPPPPGTPPTTPPTPERGDDDDDEPRATPDVGIFKEVDRGSAVPGQTIVYTINVTNRGTGTARDVVASDTMPEGTEILDVSATRGDVSQSGRSITVTIGDLGPGETVTIVVRARVTDTVVASELRNNAAVESGPPDGRTRVETSVRVRVETTPTVTATATPQPRSAPLPRQPQGNNRLPRTGTLFADVSDAAVLAVLLAAALFCLSMAARAYLGRRRT